MDHKINWKFLSQEHLFFVRSHSDPLFFLISTRNTFPPVTFHITLCFNNNQLPFSTRNLINGNFPLHSPASSLISVNNSVFLRIMWVLPDPGSLKSARRACAVKCLGLLKGILWSRNSGFNESAWKPETSANK